MNEMGMKFFSPLEIFKVQRRKDFRAPIPDGYVMYVTFTDPLIPNKEVKAKVFDISAGGLSLVIPHEEEAGFEPKKILKNMKLTLKNHDIECEGEIRYTQDLATRTHVTKMIEGIKVGIKFNKIKEADTQKIASYVLEESRKYFTRYV